MERFSGDIFSCQRELSDLVKSKSSIDSGTVDDLSLMISKFASDSFIPIEYSEKLLTNVGNLMEKCSDDDTYSLFAANTQFLGALIDIVVDFDSRLSSNATASQSISRTSFSSHRCYELTLFMILGLLDKTPLLKTFVKATSVKIINNLMKSASSILYRDHLYLTQEVALEIVCRLSHFFSQQQNSAAMQNVTANMVPEVLDAVRNPAAIPALLRDMRPLLTAINKGNPNVFPYAVRAFRVGTNWKSVDTQRNLHEHGWLDLCKDDVCYNLLEEEVLVRFPYQSIKKIHFAESEDNHTHCAQIQLHSCPKRLKDLLRKDELPPAGNCPVLLFQLDITTNPKALEEMRAVAEMRMIEHETVKRDGRKYSVVSSREQSPHAVSIALENLHKQTAAVSTTTPGPYTGAAGGGAGAGADRAFQQAVVSPNTRSASTAAAPSSGGAGNIGGGGNNTTSGSGGGSSAKKGVGRGFQSNAGGNSAHKGSVSKKNAATKKSAAAAQEDGSPSSISSPDMDVTTFSNSSQERLPHNKPGPDTLVQLANKRGKPSAATTAAAAVPSRKIAGTSAAAGRSRTRGADSLSNLHHLPTTRAATAATSTNSGKKHVEAHSGKGKNKNNPMAKATPAPAAATTTTSKANKTPKSAATSSSKKAAAAMVDTKSKPPSWLESQRLQSQGQDQDQGQEQKQLPDGEDFGFDDIYPEEQQQQGGGGGQGDDGFGDDFGEDGLVDTQQPDAPLPLEDAAEEEEEEVQKKVSPSGGGKAGKKQSAQKDKKAPPAKMMTSPVTAAAAGKAASGFAKFKGALQPLTASALNSRNLRSPVTAAAPTQAPKSAAKMRMPGGDATSIVARAVVEETPQMMPPPAALSTAKKGKGKNTAAKPAIAAPVLNKENSLRSADYHTLHSLHSLPTGPTVTTTSVSASATKAPLQYQFPLSPADSAMGGYGYGGGAASVAGSNMDARSTASKRKYGRAFHPAPAASVAAALSVSVSGTDWLSAAGDSDSSVDIDKENRTNHKRRNKEQPQGKASNRKQQQQQALVHSTARANRGSTSSFDKQQKQRQQQQTKGKGKGKGGATEPTADAPLSMRPPRPPTTTTRNNTKTTANTLAISNSSSKPKMTKLTLEPTSRALFPPHARRTVTNAAGTSIDKALLLQQQTPAGIAGSVADTSDIEASRSDQFNAAEEDVVEKEKEEVQYEMQYEEDFDDGGGDGFDEFGGTGGGGDEADAYVDAYAAAEYHASPPAVADPSVAKMSRFTSAESVPPVPPVGTAAAGAVVGKPSWRSKPATDIPSAEEEHVVQVQEPVKEVQEVGVKRPLQLLSSIGGKQQATRAELTSAAPHRDRGTQQHQQQHQQGKENESATFHANVSSHSSGGGRSVLQVPSFTQTLKAASQLSATSFGGATSQPASQPASPRSATSAASAASAVIDDEGPLSKKHKPSAAAAPSKDKGKGKGNKGKDTGRERGRGREKVTKRARYEDSDSDDDDEGVSIGEQLDKVRGMVSASGGGSVCTPSSNSMCGSSVGEQAVISALLAEIVNMQKQRAQRKRARMLANVGSGAKAQVFSFLDQWRAFAEHSSSEAQRAAHAQLEPVCASADALCSDLGADAATCLQRDANMAETVRTLEQHSVALNKEVQAALSAHRAEEAAVRNELAALRNRTLDTARKTMAMHKDLHQSKHKHQNKELLQALKQM